MKKIDLPLEDLIPAEPLNEQQRRYLRNLKKHKLEYKRVKNLASIYVNNRLKFFNEESNSYIFRVRYGIMYKLGYFFEK